jgi:hypothetical protein
MVGNAETRKALSFFVDNHRINIKGFYGACKEYKGNAINEVGKMEKSVQAFLLKVNKQKHVLQLLQKIENLTIRLVAEHSSTAFVITNTGIYILQNVTEAVDTCEVYGKIKDLQDLLSGMEKLRELVKHGKIRISASFRTVLLLESLFYLTKPEIPLVKTF